MDVKEIKRILELINGVCSEIKCEDCEYREKEIGRPYTCRLNEEEALSEAIRIIEEQEERIAIMEESGENKLNHHEVACIIADLLGDPCACNYNDNDEWLPQHCDFADTCCPNPVGVACWEQYLKHLDKKPPKEGESG